MHSTLFAMLFYTPRTRIQAHCLICNSALRKPCTITKIKIERCDKLLYGLFIDFSGEGMSKSKLDKANNQQFFFDKLTGKKFLHVSDSYQNGIKHYRFASVEHGEPLLLSEKGLKIRFDKSPDIGLGNFKKLYKKVIVRV